MDRDITFLSLTLGGLFLALLALGADLFRAWRRRAYEDSQPATLSQLLAHAPAMTGTPGLAFAAPPATRPPPIPVPVPAITPPRAAEPRAPEPRAAAPRAATPPETAPPAPRPARAPIQPPALAIPPAPEPPAALASPPVQAPPSAGRLEPSLPAVPEPSLSAVPDSSLSAVPAEETFIFRRHVARDFASMQTTEKRFRPAPPALEETPAKLDFATIQNEIRAALSSATPPPRRTTGAQLNWTEPGRLAVLSLGGATPAEGLELVRAAGVRCLLAQPGHPFGTAADIDIVSVPEGMAAAAPLAAKLRARLAAGERLAFHTETGLNGASAMLAARLSARNPAP